LTVPTATEAGDDDASVILDCDYEYEEREKNHLEVKWYHNKEPSPFLQWLPSSGGPPQIIGDKFRDHLDLSYVSDADIFRRHKAIKIRRPTLELSGRYDDSTTFIYVQYYT